jgi:beta-N-acetylhexosaminidase
MDITSFSDQQLAGQRLMVGFDGTAFNEDLKFLIDRLKVGGIILFSRNIKTPAQLTDLCSSVQKYAGLSGIPPLFVAIDQEGGQVARLKEPFTEFPGNPNMNNEEDALHFAEVTAAELLRIGVNMNMAPVMDVAPKEINSVMAGRVFGHDPDWVARLGVKVITRMQQKKIMAVAKHFPGIGRTTLDSHLDMPSLDVDLSDLMSYDMIPFEASVKHRVCGMMLSHILYKKIDPQWPASLSSRIAADLLRNQMGFAGITLTDDLDMGAIEKHYDIHTVIRQILAADIDIALLCHKGPNIETAFQEIMKNLIDYPEIRARGIKSVRRIMKLKTKYLGVGS